MVAIHYAFIAIYFQTALWQDTFASQSNPLKQFIMKTKMIFAAILFSVTGYLALAQETTVKDYLWKYDGKKKEHTLGVYAGLSGSYTEVMDKPAGWAGARLGFVLDKRFTVGLAGYALWYDHKLTELAEEGTYHLESGYAGAYFEYMQPFGNHFKLGFSLLLGQGLAKYTYDKEYREGKPWYEQTIDQQTFTVTEPGIELLFRVAPKWWIGINGSYRATSPVRLMQTPENLFNNFNGGVSVRLGIF
jgi:hypothetical protein